MILTEKRKNIKGKEKLLVIFNGERHWDFLKTPFSNFNVMGFNELQ